MSVVWLDGVLLDVDKARIDPTDRGFTLGDGVFETLRAEGGTPCHADRHLARLRSGASVLGIPVPFSDAILFDAMLSVLGRMDVSAGSLRLTLTRGPAPPGLLPTDLPRPTLLITTAPRAGQPSPARVIVARRTRRNEHSPLAGIKSLNYLDNIMARQEAESAGADDALLLNTAGYLAEATAANVVLFIDGELATPRVKDGALPGIARALLLEANGIHERQIAATDLKGAEAGFLINSLGSRPLCSLDAQLLDVNHAALLAVDGLISAVPPRKLTGPHARHDTADRNDDQEVAGCL